MEQRRTSWWSAAAHLGALIAFASLAWGYFGGAFQPDPIGEAVRRSGRYAIIFLLLSLVPTALRILFGYRSAMPARKELGLYGFKFALLHFVIYAGLDYRLDLPALFDAMWRGRFILLGLAALILMAPLAVTSTEGWVRRLGRNWRRLHRLAYVAAILSVGHYILRFKDLRAVPLIAAGLLLLLLIVRLPFVGALFNRKQPESVERTDQ